MNSGTSAQSTSAEELLAMLTDELTERLNRGEDPGIEEYVQRYPEVAPQLLQVLPALKLIRLPGQAESEGGGEILGSLGDFLMIREIGRGGMGVVYEAEQISLRRRVALKVLPFASTLDPKQLQRFKNEAEAAAHLHHQNIVPVFATGCERGVHYYAMQFIEGHTLAQVIAELHEMKTPTAKSEQEASAKCAEEPTVAGTSAAQAGIQTPPNARFSTIPSTHGRAFFHAIARLGIQAAEALDYSHELGIIHRDIKPANMLVDGRSKLWITDFGLAHCQSQAGLTMSGDLLGTLRYMSPEQALAKRVIVDHRTDIYSLGATLYELLTGEPVFDGADRQELLRQIAFEEPKSLKQRHKSVAAELETIVLKAIEKNPAERYESAKEMAEDLERFVKDEPIRARRPSLARRVRNFCRRHKAVVWSAALALLATALTAAGGVGWVARDHAARQMEAVREDLQEADTWQRENQWPRALKALVRAQDRIDLAGPESLRAEVEQRRREAAFVVELEKIPLQIVDVGGPDIEGAQRAYRAAFAANGLDVGAVPAEEIARRIKELAIRVHVIRALDYWAYSKDTDSKVDGVDLRRIAQMADNDPWRQQLRKPEIINDRTALAKLAGQGEIAAQPPESFLFLASLLDKAKALPEAVELLRKGNRAHPTNFMINYMLGNHLGSSMYRTDVFAMNSRAMANEAIGFARAAVALNPQSPAAYLSLAYAIGEAKKLTGWDDGLWSLRKAIELKPDYSAAYNHYGIALHNEKKYDEAEAAFRKAIKLKPDSWAPYCNLGNTLRGQKRLREAEDAYREAIKLKRDSDQTYYNLALILHDQKKFTEAEAAFREAIKLNPDDGAAYGNLSITLHELQRFRDALYAFTPIIKRKLDFPNAHYNAAICAALASDGPRATELVASERTQLRRQALDWLRVELADVVAQSNAHPARDAVLFKKMELWQEDPGFNALRGQEALAKLSEGERLAWQKLWDDVEALKRQAAPRGFSEGRFFQDWLVLSELLPYEGTDGQKALDQKLLPDENILRPRTGDKVVANGKTLSWKEHHAQGYLNFERLYGSRSEHHVAYAVCYIRSAAARCDLVLRVGSDDQSLIYLNGEEVYRNTKARSLILDNEETRLLQLRQGTNVVVFKVVNQGGPGPHGSLHLVTRDGAAPEGIEYRLTP
jgi:serine/threonine protein kinase/Flp pilus assembly protein TadD